MIRVRQLLPLAVLLSLAAGAPAPAAAQSIVDDWASAQAPPAPTLQPVTVDPKTTALLMLDFLKENCAPNPRCMATLPAVQKLLAAARAAHALVVYTNFPGTKIATDTLAPVKPLGHEPTVTAFLDKFTGTSLDKILKAKHIKSVIVVGSAANGAVMYTGTAAFFHHYQTIVPVDGLSGASAYIDQYSVFNFIAAPVMAGHVVLTRTDMIKF
jgi:nicotinamidase-related amidase